jgi:hypothetical protein
MLFQSVTKLAECPVNSSRAAFARGEADHQRVSSACLLCTISVLNHVRQRSILAVTSGTVAIQLSGGRSAADYPSALGVPKHVAVFFHAPERRFRSLGMVLDRPS